MTKFSVMVPVYNAESYLKRCLDSIVNQNYENLDVILVNDGSTDRSAEICDQYATKDARFKVIHQKNKGLPGARNSALEFATGEYLCFLDNDDFLEKNFFKILNEATHSKADVISFNYYEEKQQQKLVRNQEDEIRVDDIFLSNILVNTSNSNFFWFVWRRIYKSEFLKKHHIKFDETAKFGEDSIFNIEVFSCYPKYEHIPDILYNYCENQDSMVRSKYKENLLEKFEHQFSARIALQKKYNYNTEKSNTDISNYFMNNILSWLITNVKYSQENKIVELKKIRDSKIYIFAFKYYKYDWKHPKKSLLVKLFELRLFSLLLKF